MKFIKLIAVFFTVIIGLIGCSPGDGPARQGVVIADSDSYQATIYRQNCAICHGREGYGKPVDGKVVPSLRTGDAAKRTEAEIYKQIAHGKLPMPSFRDQLTERELRLMVDFVMYDLQARKRPHEK